MKRPPSLLIFAVLMLLFSPHPAPAQGNEYVKSHYDKFEYRIPMRDGVHLFTAVYVPKDSSQKYPLLMIRTQSGVRPYGVDQYPNDLGPSPLFGKAGYIFVQQDIRGRWMSEGTFVNMRPHNPAKKTPTDIDESSDTFDTIDWLLKRVPNHNGKVGLFGTSYRGFLVAAGTIDAHPALKAAVQGAPIMDWFIGDDWRHNGALFLAHAFFYMPLQGKLRPTPHMTPPARFDFGTPDAYDFYLRMGPLANADAKHFKGDVPFWNEVLKHDTYDDHWKARNLRPHLKNIKPAVMTVGGWFDAENLFGALEASRSIESASPGTNHALVMGPWLHGGWNSGQGDGSALGDVTFGSKTADYYREKLELPFFEFHLKGKGEFKLPKARVFETGRNHWRDYTHWPPANTKPLTLHFHSGGRLSEKSVEGSGNTTFDEYISDPAKPVPYFDKIGTRMLPEFMIADQRFAARRPDVLVYETDALVQDIRIAGPILAELHVSTSGTDSDWIVKLIDVYPDDAPDPVPKPSGMRMGGYQQLVRGEVMRGKFRNSFEKPEAFTPDKPTAVRIQLPDACHTFRSGHKIMVQVQSSWFPLVDRNPQSFANIALAKESDFQKATQRLYRSKDLPSRIVLQLLP